MHIMCRCNITVNQLWRLIILFSVVSTENCCSYKCKHHRRMKSMFWRHEWSDRTNPNRDRNIIKIYQTNDCVTLQTEKFISFKLQSSCHFWNACILLLKAAEVMTAQSDPQAVDVWMPLPNKYDCQKAITQIICGDKHSDDHLHCWHLEQWVRQAGPGALNLCLLTFEWEYSVHAGREADQTVSWKVPPLSPLEALQSHTDSFWMTCHNMHLHQSWGNYREQWQCCGFEGSKCEQMEFLL